MHQGVPATHRVRRTTLHRGAMTHRLAPLTAIGVAQVILVAAGLVVLTASWLPFDHDTRVVVFMVGICAASLLWLLAVGLVRGAELPRRAVWIVLGMAIAMR